MSMPSPEKTATIHGLRAAWNAYLGKELVRGPLKAINLDQVRMALEIGSGGTSFSRDHLPSSISLHSTDVRPFSGLDVLCSGLMLPFKNGTFDLVLCLRVLQHVDDDVGTMREVFRVTKPHGLAVIEVGNRHSWTLVQGRMDNPRWRRRIPYDRYHAYSAKELVAKMRRTGFADVRVKGSLFLPEAVNRLPATVALALVKSGPLIDRIANVTPGIRSAATNILAWGLKP